MSRWPTGSLLDRLLARTARDERGCLVWTGYRDRNGYGHVNLDGTKQFAHRLSYELQVGPVPDSLELDHLCRNRACVEPAHLEAVTHAENVRRGESPFARNGRATSCPQGHEYDDANTGRTRSGRRFCRQCSRDSAMRQHVKNRDARLAQMKARRAA